MTGGRASRTVVLFAEHELVVGNREALKQFGLRLAADRCNLIIDFRDTGYMDSGGLGVLVSLARHFHRDGLGFVVCSLNLDIAELFALTKMGDVFHVAKTIEEARLLVGDRPPPPGTFGDDEPEDPPPTLTLHR